MHFLRRNTVSQGELLAVWEGIGVSLECGFNGGLVESDAEAAIDFIGNLHETFVSECYLAVNTRKA